METAAQCILRVKWLKPLKVASVHERDSKGSLFCFQVRVVFDRTRESVGFHRLSWSSLDDLACVCYNDGVSVEILSFRGPKMLEKLKDARLYQNVIRDLEPKEIVPYEDFEAFMNTVLNQSHPWPMARRVEIRKNFSSKRRIVYNYPKPEMFFFRTLNHYLVRAFRNSLSPSYFPSQGRNPSQCLSILMDKLNSYSRLLHIGVHEMYGLHMDISDYFNSMDPEILFSRFPEKIQEDDAFRQVYNSTIRNPYCVGRDGKVTGKTRGMAGLPVTAFFSAIFLSGMDKFFEDRGIPYARYSDDILFFSADESGLQQCESFVIGYIEQSGLSVNLFKTERIYPGEPWTFIGFEVDGDTIDIAPHAEEKIKKRVARWARRMRKRVEQGYGQPLRKTTPEKAAASLVRTINRALFRPIKDKYCWARWAFPAITTTKRLEALDAFIQEKIRYVYTGRYSRTNYRVLPYTRLVEMGYHSLIKLYKLYQYRPEVYQHFVDALEASPMNHSHRSV